jgi:hypothetical protein
VHVEPLLRNRCESRPTRGIPDFAVELHALGLERLTPTIEVAHRARLIDPVRPPCNDACRHQDETEERKRDR